MLYGGACCIKRFTAAALIIGLAVWSSLILFPAPLVIETQQAGGEVYFSANRGIVLKAGDCVTLRWEVEQIQAVYLNEQPQTGSGEENFCITGAHPTLRVIFTDNSETIYSLNVQVLLSHPLTWFVAALVALHVRTLLSRPAYAVVIAILVYVLFDKLLPLSEVVATANWREASIALATLAGACTLVFFFGVMVWARGDAVRQPRWMIGAWLISAGILLAVIAGVILYVNPRGMYFAKAYTPHQLLLRESKLAGYGQLAATPDVIIMGSSRAFTLSPEDVQTKTGLTAYNMAIEGGRIEDILIMVRQMPKLPRVLLIEVQEGLPREPDDIAARAPLSWIPYMPLETALLTIEKRLTGLVDLSHFSEALYMLLYHDLYERQPREWPYFAADGMAIRPTITASELEQTLLLDIGNIPAEHCDQVDAVSQSDMKALIEMAAAQDAHLVFYISPRHPSYSDALLNDDPHYQGCRSSFITYMQNLTQQHDHVFFTDASQVETLDISEAGFYDSQHLTQANSSRIIDFLADTLRTAGRE
jgi:hypothetical protein